MAIIGAGNLGTALANYGGLSKRGFDVVALYDTDARKIGSNVGEIEIQDLESLDGDCRHKSFDIAILAVPAVAAQQVAERLVNRASVLAGWSVTVARRSPERGRSVQPGAGV